MDGISAVLSRISEIDARIASMRPAAAPVTVVRPGAASPSSAGASSGQDFASVLAGTGTVGQPAGPAQSAAQPQSAHHLVPRQLVAQQNAAATSATSATTATSTTAAPSAAVGSTTSATATAPAVGGARNAAGVPLDLAAYGNGKVPASALQSIGHGQHRLWGPAAQNFQRMEAAAARDGIRLKVTDSYRSYESQVELAGRKGLYSQGGLAARPGTSEHGWGLSIDVDTSGGTLAWMRANAEKYGFTENVRREPWHWTYTAR